MEALEMVKKVNSGEKVICPKCNSGIIIRPYNNVYECDNCRTRMICRMEVEWDSKSK